MARRKVVIPDYGTVTINGVKYYRTRIQNAEGKMVPLYARSPEELYDKELEAYEKIDNATFNRKSPTVAEYCEKWLLMQSVHESYNFDGLHIQGQASYHQRTRGYEDSGCQLGRYSDCPRPGIKKICIGI